MVFKTDYRLMQAKRIAECSKWEHSAILLTFIKLPIAIKTLVLSIFELPFYTGFHVYTVYLNTRFALTFEGNCRTGTYSLHLLYKHDKWRFVFNKTIFNILFHLETKTLLLLS